MATPRARVPRTPQQRMQGLELPACIAAQHCIHPPPPHYEARQVLSIGLRHMQTSLEMSRLHKSLPARVR